MPWVVHSFLWAGRDCGGIRVNEKEIHVEYSKTAVGCLGGTWLTLRQMAEPLKNELESRS